MHIAWLATIVLFLDGCVTNSAMLQVGIIKEYERNNFKLNAVLISVFLLIC